MGVLYIVKPDKNHYKNLNFSINIDNIYKVGLSHKKRLDRLTDYGKDAWWIRSELVKDERYLEKVLIKKMKEKYDKPVYGREYFICKNYEDIKVIFSDVIKLDREPLNKELVFLDNLYNKNLIIKYFNIWKKIDKKISIVLSPNTKRWIKCFAKDDLYKGSKWDNKLNNVYVNDSFFTTIIFNKHKTKLELRFKNGFNVPAMKIINKWYDLDIYIMLSRICPRIKNKMLNSVEIWWNKVMNDGGFEYDGHFIEWGKTLKVSTYDGEKTFGISVKNKKKEKRVVYSKDWLFKCYDRQSYNGRKFDNSSFWREIKRTEGCLGDLYAEKRIQVKKERRIYIFLPSLEDARNKWNEI